MDNDGNYRNNVSINCVNKNIYSIWLVISLVGRVFANGRGDLGSIPVQVIHKLLKMVLDTPFLNTHQYKIHIKGKVEQSRERSSGLPTPRCSSYWKWSHLVALDHDRQQLYSIVILFMCWQEATA